VAGNSHWLGRGGAYDTRPAPTLGTFHLCTRWVVLDDPGADRWVGVSSPSPFPSPLYLPLDMSTAWGCSDNANMSTAWGCRDNAIDAQPLP